MPYLRLPFLSPFAENQICLEKFYGVPWQLVLGEPMTELELDLRLSEFSTVTRITTLTQWQEEREPADSSKLCQKVNCHSISWGDYFVTHYEDRSSLQFAKYSIQYMQLCTGGNHKFLHVYSLIFMFLYGKGITLLLPLWLDEYSQALSLPWNCHLSAVTPSLPLIYLVYLPVLLLSLLTLSW